jgi:hypothetical protein
VSTVAIERTPSIWDRVATRLNNWGSKVTGFAKRVGGWFASKTKWFWNSKPVQWVATKTSFIASKAWAVAKGPILWVAGPIIAFWTMPTTATILLGVGVLALGVTAYFTWRGWRRLQEITTPEELHEIIDRLEHLGESSNPNASLAFEEEPVPGETIQERVIYLDEMLKQADDTRDVDKFSEATARMNLLEVRSGGAQGIKQGAAANTVYQHCRKTAEQRFPDYPWNWRLMHRATLAEDRRRKDVEKSLSVVPAK